MYTFDFDYTTDVTLTVYRGGKEIMSFQEDDAQELYDELVQCTTEEERQEILSAYDYDSVC